MCRARPLSSIVHGGGKRPFGYDVVDKRLVPNPREQEAIARMRTLRAEAKTYREIGLQIATEFGDTLPPMTIKRILGRQYLARSAAKDVEAKTPEAEISHAEGAGER